MKQNKGGRPRNGPSMAERVKEYAELRSAGETVAGAAKRMGVSYKSALHYAALLRKQEGVDSRWREWSKQARPRIVAHLRNHPQAELSSYELARVLGEDEPENWTKSVDWILRGLIAEGVVELVPGVRDAGRDMRPVRRYRYRTEASGSAVAS